MKLLPAHTLAWAEFMKRIGEAANSLTVSFKQVSSTFEAVAVATRAFWDAWDTMERRRRILGWEGVWLWQ